jgi:GDP-mannose 4,6 dehydratase
MGFTRAEHFTVACDPLFYVVTHALGVCDAKTLPVGYWISGGIMKVLITGGAGFIGSHLAQRCLERGDEVYIIDDLSTGSIENILHFKDHPRLTYYIDTVCNHWLAAQLIDTCDIIWVRLLWDRRKSREK